MGYFTSAALYSSKGHGFFGVKPLPPTSNPLVIVGFSFHALTFFLSFQQPIYLINGQQLNSISSRASNGNLSIQISGILMQNFFTQVTFTHNIFGALTYTTASADTFGTGGGSSTWTWNAQTFNAGNVGGTATFT